MKKQTIVIGSGLAGSLVCKELSKTSKVTLLEIGGKDTIIYPTIHFSNKHFGCSKNLLFWVRWHYKPLG